MFTLRQPLAVLLCLVYVPHITSAFSRRSGIHKRSGEVTGARSRRSLILSDRVFFKSNSPEKETVAAKYSSVIPECDVGGSPTPTIHWLRNGVRIQQSFHHAFHDDEAQYEDLTSDSMLRLSSTKSRLFLDCITPADMGTYTCVADIPTSRISRNTDLIVEKRDNILYSEISECRGRRSDNGEPARIYMWTSSRLEYEDTVIQLFCRAQGYPRPTVTWFDRDNEPIERGDQYKIARNGDLIIYDLRWSKNMGVYTCVAENAFGSDSVEAFVYPTARSEDSSL